MLAYDVWVSITNAYVAYVKGHVAYVKGKQWRFVRLEDKQERPWMGDAGVMTGLSREVG